ncbi:MAG TPA: glycosyltransferase family 4 protein [Candidatus Bathyarchaeia archaeon]|nr:glycosyltransferase family 4 protein [Candidatus Bathyarchaeia archaeon]
MRINFAMYNIGHSGGTRGILEIANRLEQRGHDVTLTVPLPAERDYGVKWSSKVKVIRPPCGRYIEGSLTLDYLVRGCFAFARRLGYRRAFEADLVKRLSEMVPNCDVNVATLAPTAFAIHRSGKGKPFYYVQGYEPWSSEDPYVSKIAEEALLLPMSLIAVSRWVQGILREKCGKESYLSLPGVNHEVFHPDGDMAPRSSRKRIMCIGRTLKWKGFSDIVSAMNLVFKKIPNVELTVVTPDRISLEGTEFPYQIIQSPNDETLASYYRSCDVFVSASHFESFSSPPIEAMASGRPVVTTSGGPEEYAVNELNSLVIPPKNPAVLADAVVRLLNDPNLSKRLSEEGVATAGKFTWDKSATRFEEIFRNALN